MIPSQPVCMRSGEATHTNFLVFAMTRPGSLWLLIVTFSSLLSYIVTTRPGRGRHSELNGETKPASVKIPQGLSRSRNSRKDRQ